MYDFGYVFDKVTGQCIAWFEDLEDAKIYARLKNRQADYDSFGADSTDLTFGLLRSFNAGSAEVTAENLSSEGVQRFNAVS